MTRDDRCWCGRPLYPKVVLRYAGFGEFERACCREHLPGGRRIGEIVAGVDLGWHGLSSVAEAERAAMLEIARRMGVSSDGVSR